MQRLIHGMRVFIIWLSLFGIWFLSVMLSRAQAQSYVFGTASYAVPGTGPIVTADFNGDGIPDLAIQSSSPTACVVSVFLGKPDGTFGPRVDYTDASSCPDNLLIVVGDFNNDGRLDIVSENPTNGSLSILIGNGDGTFQSATPVNMNAGVSSASAMVAADFNGDGRMDLALSADGFFVVLLGNGDGTFKAPVDYPVPFGAYLFVGDFNGDGKPDVATAGSEYTGTGNVSTISVLLNEGDGTFKPHVDYSVPGEALALVGADFNNDGKLDLALATGGLSAGVSVLLGFGDGAFASPITYASKLLSVYATSLAVADFNGDGKLDIAMTDDFLYFNSVAILRGNGDGTFQNPPLLYSGGFLPAAMVALDMNGDGKPDLAVVGGNGVASYFSVSVLINRGDGTFPNRSTYSVPQYPYSVVLGDFNGDGKPDIAVTCYDDPGQVSVLLGNNDGTFQSHLDTTTGTYPSAIAAGDFNADGKLDLVVIETLTSSSALATLLGNGDGTFQNNISQTIPCCSGSIAVGDFNGDGKLDLAVVIYGINSVFVFLGNGDGSFAAPVQYATGPIQGSPPYHNVLAADFKGDGKLGLAVTTDNGVSILLGKGDGTFLPHQDILAGQQMLAIADFNGDGKPDLVVVTGSGLISVALGNGDGTFQLASGFQIPSVLNTQSVVVGDFNSDGKLDLAFASQSSEVATILLGNGDGTFSRHIDYAAGSVGSNVNFTVAGDFNGDGGLDLALANYSDQTVSVFLNSPIAAIAPSHLAFAAQPIGTESSEQIVNLVNRGAAPLAISNFAVSGDFMESGDCPSILGVDKGCQMAITFEPEAAGARAGWLVVSDDSSGVAGNMGSVSLSGTGWGPMVDISPHSLAFPATRIDTTSKPQFVKLSNVGNAPLKVTGVEASGGFGAISRCGISVPPGASCTVRVTFTPLNKGTLAGILTIEDNAHGRQTVSLTGKGS